MMNAIESAKHLKGAMVFGSAFNAIFHSDVFSQSFSVTTTDWGLVAQAATGVDAILAERTSTRAQLNVIYYEPPTTPQQGKLQNFWRSIYECSKQ